MPESKELNFTWKDFIETNNSILVGTIGNYIHRVVSLAHKNFGRTLKITSVSPGVKKEVEKTFKLTAQHLEKAEFRVATQEVVNLATFGNQYVDKKQLWKLVKDNPKEAKKVSQDLLYIVDSLRILLYPFTPEGALKLNTLLGYEKKDLEAGKDIWVASGSLVLNFPATIAPIFEKIDEKNIRREVEKLEQGA
jgi:methionyl-tRNA synthetase